MPKVSAWMIRASLVALVCGGALGLSGIVFPFTAAPIVHADVMLLGFMLPFAFGTAAWILPKRGGVRPVGIPAAVYFAGLLLLLAAHIAQVGVIDVVGRVIIMGGAALFVRALLPRVRHIEAVRRQTVSGNV